MIWRDPLLVHETVLMLVVDYMQGIGRLWIIRFYTSWVLLKFCFSFNSSHVNIFIFSVAYYFIIFSHSLFCLTTGPKPPSKRFLHIVRSRVSSFKWEYPLLSLRSSISFLRLFPRLLVTSISLFIFPSITCFRRQFLRKMWPIQLVFLLLISYMPLIKIYFDYLFGILSCYIQYCWTYTSICIMHENYVKH